MVFISSASSREELGGEVLEPLVRQDPVVPRLSRQHLWRSRVLSTFRGRLAWLSEGSLSGAVILMNYDKPPARQAEVPAFLLPDRNLMGDAQRGQRSDAARKCSALFRCDCSERRELQVARFRSPPSPCRVICQRPSAGLGLRNMPVCLLFTLVLAEC